jgi:hypothetical protein
MTSMLSLNAGSKSGLPARIICSAVVNVQP